VAIASCEGRTISALTKGSIMIKHALLRSVAASGVAILSGCSGGKADTPEGASFSVDGSSTVLPLARTFAELARGADSKASIRVSASGTGGGLEKLCNKQVEVAGASRPINAAEVSLCKENGVEYVEVPIAFDSLAVVVNGKNEFIDCLTTAELKMLWSPEAEHKVSRWSQVRSSFPDQPIELYGPDKASGTFDYFTLAIVGEERSSRADYTASEDDEVTVRGVAEHANALGYFGYAYYDKYKHQLKVVSIDHGRGCVKPSASTVADASYQPLTRPLMLYVDGAAARRPALQRYVNSFLDVGHAQVVRQDGYVPLPAAALEAQSKRFASHAVGTSLGGRGSVIGLDYHLFDEEERERIRTLLVQ
jgi:phosphate transport system substrate-binding protein